MKKQFSWHLFLILFVLALAPSFAAEKEKTPRQILSEAIGKGDLMQVQSLIESKAVGIDEIAEKYSDKTPLVEASMEAQFPIMQFLVEKRASLEGISGRKSTPLTKLIEGGSKKLSCDSLKEMVLFLLKAGADINNAGENGYTPLMTVCKYTRCNQLMEMFLDQGALVDVQANDNNTALSLTVRSGNIKAFRLLVQRGANTSLNCKGNSLLGIAAIEGNIVMAGMIMEELKADLKKYDNDGSTPLHQAAIFGQTSMVSFLVAHGADINAPLLSELSYERKDNTKFFSLSKDVVTFPKNSTPLTLARWANKISTANLLADLGGMEILPCEIKEYEQSMFYPYTRTEKKK